MMGPSSQVNGHTVFQGQSPGKQGSSRRCQSPLYQSPGPGEAYATQHHLIQAAFLKIIQIFGPMHPLQGFAGSRPGLVKLFFKSRTFAEQKLVQQAVFGIGKR